MTAPPCDQTLLDDAVRFLRAAGDLTLQWYRSAALAVEHKGDGTPVTQADKAAERFLREQIHDAYPEDSIIGEEEDDRAGTSARTWIIDPIDGTKAFTHGVALYCNLLAVNDEHGPAVGVINLPALGETVYAGRGLGCFCNDAPARVSPHGSVRDAYVSSTSYSNWTDEQLLDARRAGVTLRTWGDGYGYALVATGRIDAMIDVEVALWDVAPMPVIMAEAGGVFTDFAGDARADGGSGIATNGLIHDEVRALLGAGG